MRLAVDFDNTWTADPALFAGFIALAVARGHQVCVVTGRANTEEDRQTVRQFVPREIPVYYTGGAMKRWYMEQQAELKVNVWIDDSPETIGRG